MPPQPPKKPPTCDQALTSALEALEGKLREIFEKQAKTLLEIEKVTPGKRAFIMGNIKKIAKDAIAEIRENPSLGAVTKTGSVIEDRINEKFHMLIDQYVKNDALEKLIQLQIDEGRLTSASAIKGFLDRLVDGVEIDADMSKTVVVNKLYKAFENVERGGVRADPDVIFDAKMLMKNTIEGGDDIAALIKDAGFDDWQLEIYRAMYHGTHETIPELDVIGRAWKLFDEDQLNGLKEANPHLKSITSHVLPIRTNSDKLYIMGQEKFSDFIDTFVNKEGNPILHDTKRVKALLKGKKYVDLTREQQMAFDKKYAAVKVDFFEEIVEPVEFSITPQWKSGRLEQISRELKFQGPEDEYKFMQTVGETRNNNVLRDGLSYRQSRAAKAALGNRLGPHIGNGLNTVYDKLYKHALDNGHAVGSPEVFKKTLSNTFAPLNAGLAGGVGEIEGNIIKGMNSLVSGTLTGFTALRTIGYDGSFHVAAVRRGLTGESVWKGTAQAMWGMMDKAKSRAQLDEYRALFEEEGFLMQLKMHHVAMSVSNHLDHVVPKGSGASGAFARGADQLASVVSKYSLADRTWMAGRVHEAARLGGLFVKAVDNGWDNTNQNLRNALTEFGITSKEFDIYKKVGRLKDPFRDRDILLDSRAFQELTIDDLKPVMLKGESVSGARNRLLSMYRNMMHSTIDDLSPRVTASTRFSTPGAKPLTRLLESSAYKFLSIVSKQWRAYQRGAARGSGFDPYRISGGAPSTGGVGPATYASSGADFLHAAINNPKYYGELIVHAAAGGYMAMWMYDIANGKTPRELSRENTTEALATAGMGGLIGSIYGNLVHSGTPVSLPVVSVVKPFAQFAKGALTLDSKKTRRGLAKSLTKVPLLNLWWNRAVVERGARGILGVPTSAHEKRLLKKRGQRRL